MSLIRRGIRRIYLCMWTRKSLGLETAVWSVAKIPKVGTADRQEAGIGIMGMKIQRWYTRKEFPSCLCLVSPSFELEHSNESSWGKPLTNWLLLNLFYLEGDIKNKIFLTLQGISWWRRKVHSRAQKSASIPISKAKRVLRGKQPGHPGG